MSKADQRRPGEAIRQRRGHARGAAAIRRPSNTKTKTPLGENGAFKPTAIGIQGLGAVSTTLNHRLNFGKQQRRETEYVRHATLR
jgi:hypothetical protein